MQCLHRFFLLLILFGWTAAAQAGDYQPDAYAVQRYGPAYRYPQAGWIVLHIEGEPYERGYQHGRLMAPEIAGFVRCFAAVQSPSAPTEGWRHTRRLTSALFLRRFEKEYLEEMKGIADGATAAGARYDNRPIDLIDMAALNSWPEIDTLDSGLEALPTGLEGMRFPHRQPRAMPPPAEMHCSAFAATGPATRDGKVVIGHITMFGLYPSNFYNVWIDVKPTRGHRVLMQAYPGGIQSGMDYYLNDAGLVITETTLAQTRFDGNGNSEASRIRQALQYADGIDKAVEILKTANNGLYTNEWLIADIKTNEIAMFELGTHHTRLYRSSKNEWFGGTEGFYWGCNNTKDLEVRLETIPGVQGRPANMVFCPSDRDLTWQRLYREHKGKIDADFGKLAFTTPPLAAYHSLDAKFTTTEMARQLKTWALFGPPLGRTWQPTEEDRRRYPEIRPLVSNPWTILHAAPPAKGGSGTLAARDISEPLHAVARSEPERRERQSPPTVAAWHGTLLPESDSDIWLAVAFADYERHVARANALRQHPESDGKATAVWEAADREQLGVSLFGFRSTYLTAARAGGDVALTATHAQPASSDWYRIAAGKGVLLLHELEQLLGRAAFAEMMDSFGRQHAGQRVTTAQFQAHAEHAAGRSLNAFFAPWLNQPGLPRIQVKEVTVQQLADGQYEIKGQLQSQGPALWLSVPVTVETADGDKSQNVMFDKPTASFTILSSAAPRQLLVDKYGGAAAANGGIYATNTYYGELEGSLIIYGTADEAPANREAAEALQHAIRQRHANVTVPIKEEGLVTDADLRTHHVLLIGRPDSNRLVQRFQGALPIRCGQGSFTVRQDVYAHPGSAVVVAAANPLNPRYSLVVVMGLSAAATLQAAPELVWQGHPAAEILVFPNKASCRRLVVPAKEWIRALDLPVTDAPRTIARPSGAP
jgi:hypothetical protein